MTSRRKGFTLPEVIISIVILTIAIFALIEVFAFSVRMTAASSIDSSEVLEAHALAQQTFFIADLSDTSNVTLISDSATLEFKKQGGTEAATINLKRYDFGKIGEDKSFRIYRPDL